MQPPTYAAGVRRRFEDLPSAVTAWVAEQLGGPPAGVRNVVGGFSPGVAAVVTSTAGRSVFVKAVGEAVNAGALQLCLAEREVTSRLPRLDGIVLPTAGTELEVAGERYAVLLFPALDGAPPRHPWRAAELRRVLDALHALSVQLTPSPWTACGRDARLPNFFRWWDRVIGDADDPWRTHPWVQPRAAALLAAEATLRSELGGNTLSHIDLRADNLVLTPDRVHFVDWAHVQNAAPWVDAALLLADVVASRADVADGGEIEVTAAAQHPALHGLDPSAFWRVLVGLAGALHGLSRQPDPPGLPTIRRWQSATSDTLLRWCQRNAPEGLR